MLTEPNIDKKLIQLNIEENYAIKVSHLSFIKGGEASWGYKVEVGNGQTYFFKIHTGLEEYKKRFQLTYRLFTDCGIKNITHPIKNKQGELVVFLDKYPAALFNFIAGLNAAQKPLNEKERFAVGVLLGRIHKAKEIIGDFSLQEDFLYGNTNRLLDTLEKASWFINNESSYKSKTVHLLLENKEKILKRLQILKELGDTLRHQNLDFVICHGEPHNWNTMIDQKGEIYLIDWDDSLFAPKEKDLHTIKDDPIKLAGYQSIIGEYSFNKDVLRYYDLEWNISEIDAWSTSIFYTESNDIQNQHFVDELVSDLKELNYS